MPIKNATNCFIMYIWLWGDEKSGWRRGVRVESRGSGGSDARVEARASAGGKSFGWRWEVRVHGGCERELWTGAVNGGCGRGPWTRAMNEGRELGPCARDVSARWKWIRVTCTGTRGTLNHGYFPPAARLAVKRFHHFDQCGTPEGRPSHRWTIPALSEWVSSLLDRPGVPF